MKVLVCDDRGSADVDLIRSTIDRLGTEYGQIEALIHGDCRSADKLAGKVAEEMGIRVIACVAQGNRYGRVVDPKRNQQGIDEEPPDLVAALHDDLERSRGIKDMLRRADKAGIKTVLVCHRSEYEEIG